MNQWWVLVLLILWSLLTSATAFALTMRRDLGAGMRATRPGPANAARSLITPLGLAWRLQHGTLYAWTAAIVIFGVVYGVIGDEIADLVGDSAQAADVIEQLGGGEASLADAYFAAVLGLMAVAAAAYAVQAILRLRSEETGGRAEPVLAAAVSRDRWALSHFGVAVAGVVVLMLIMGVSTGLSYGLVTHDVGDSVASLTAAAAARIPAVLVLAGLALAVVGALPRLAVGLAWGVLAGCLLVGQIGTFLDFPSTVLDLSPFTHSPTAPVGGVSAVPLGWLLLVAALLTVGGLAALRRRDIPA
jgi:ABC-2 type transport system permease protein